MIHESRLKNANYEQARVCNHKYFGAGNKQIKTANRYINIRVHIDNVGEAVFKNVIVSQEPKESNVMLIGTPDIVRMGLNLDYKAQMIKFQSGKLAGKMVKMKNFNRSKDINNIIVKQQVIDLFDDHVLTVTEQDSVDDDVSSNTAICGDPCMYETDCCTGCDKCIDKKLADYIEKYKDEPPCFDAIGIDGKTALMAYIERIRQRSRATYTHEECTIDEELVRSKPVIAQKLKLLFQKYKQVFAGDIGCVGKAYAVKGKMVGRTSPQRPGHSDFTGNTKLAVIKQFANLAAQGIIKNVHELGITPKNILNVLPVKKKDDDGNILKMLNALRIVVDSRTANGQTLFCGKRTDNLNDALHFAARTSKAGYNIKADIADAYYVIPLDEELWPYFCVDIPILGTYCFVRMVQGWAPAAQICQEVLTRIFFPLFEYLRKYMDDLILAVPTEDLYLKKVEQFLSICLANGIRLKGKKFFCGVKKFNYLGHYINNGLITPSEHYKLRLKAVKYTDIKTKSQLKSFIQSLSYLQKYTNRSTDLLHALREMAKGEGKDQLNWTETSKFDFEKAKMALNELADLHPFDPELKTVLVVDTSKVATGGFIYQLAEDGPRLIQFFNRARRDKERKRPLSSCHMELLGLKSMVIAMLYLLRQCKQVITVVTDSRAVVKIFEKFKKYDLPSHDTLLNNAVYAILSVLDVNVIHAKNTNSNLKFADALSRLGIMREPATCIGQPSCTICEAANPENEDRGHFINVLNTTFNENLQLQSLSNNDEVMENILDVPLAVLNQKFYNFEPEYLFKIQPELERLTLKELLNNSKFLLSLQLQDKDLKMLHRDLLAGRVSYPKRQQRLQNKLETRNAKIENGVIKLDKYIDGVKYRVIPLPGHCAIVAIQAIHKTIGHQSVTQLQKQAVRYFEIPKLNQKVKLFAEKCSKCCLYRGSSGYKRDKMKPVPLPNDLYTTILVDEVTRTYKGKNIKFLLAMEAVSGFITVLCYDKVMNGARFIQCMAQIKTILSPHGLDTAKISVRCDRASWHSSVAVKEALSLMGIDMIFYESNTFSKNIIPELDAKIRVFGQYLSQIVESSPWDFETCCYAAAAKCNSAISSLGHSPAEVFVGRGWKDGKTIQIDTNSLLKQIADRRESRRNYENKKLAESKLQKQKDKILYKNDALNAPLVSRPKILKLKPGDKVTLKVNPGKNSFRSGYNVLKVDFSKSRVFIQRDSGRDEVPAIPFWITFDVIDHVFLEEDQLYWIQCGHDKIEKPHQRVVDKKITNLLAGALNVADVFSYPTTLPEQQWLPRMPSPTPSEFHSEESVEVKLEHKSFDDLWRDFKLESWLKSDLNQTTKTEPLANGNELKIGPTKIEPNSGKTDS